jgi:hypothetical protein
LLVQGIELLVIVSIGVLMTREPFVRLWYTPAGRMAAVIAASAAALAIYYVSFSEAEHFYARYLAPLMLLSVALIAVSLSGRGRLVSLLTLLAVISALGFAALQLKIWFVEPIEGGAFYDEQLQLVQEHVPAGGRVAAGQSGTLGYFRDNVVNLDGKVNADIETGDGNLGMTRRLDYLEAEGIIWYCDWLSYATGQLGRDPGAAGWELVAVKGRAHLFHRVEPAR